MSELLVMVRVTAKTLVCGLLMRTPKFSLSAPLLAPLVVRSLTCFWGMQWPSARAVPLTSVLGRETKAARSCP